MSCVSEIVHNFTNQTAAPTKCEKLCTAQKYTPSLGSAFESVSSFSQCINDALSRKTVKTNNNTFDEAIFVNEFRRRRFYLPDDKYRPTHSYKIVPVCFVITFQYFLLFWHFVTGRIIGMWRLLMHVLIFTFCTF